MIEFSGLSGGEGPFLSVAGDTLNTAVYLKRILGKCADIHYLTVLGNDPLSIRIQDFIEDESINTDYIRQSKENKCGIYVIENDKIGERTFHYWRANSAARNLFQSEKDFNCLESAKIIYLSGITLAILSKQARASLIEWLRVKRQEKNIFFDINFRQTLWPDLDEAREILKKVMRLATLCFPSEEDLRYLFGSISNSELTKGYCQNPNELIIIKKGGGKPPEIVWGEYKSLKLKDFIKLDEVLDATGAGDSFNAGFIGAHLMGQTLSNSLMFANDLASRTLNHLGAICPAEQTKEFDLSKH